MALSEALDRAQDLMAHAQGTPEERDERIFDASASDLDVFRAKDDALFSQFSLGDATVEEVEYAGVPCLSISTPGARTDQALLYCHGGGYVVGSAIGRSVVSSYISRAGGFRVIAADYRLAPEHPFPAAL